MHRSVIALLVAGILCTSGVVPSATLRAATREDDKIVRIYQRLAPATVLLSATYETARAMPDSAGSSVGAGFIVEKSGTLLTNAHVVEGAKTVTATLFDGTRLPVEVRALDSDQDIAIVRLPAADRDYPSVVIGDSDMLQVGQQTLVVGSPFGLGFTLTSGIISGLGPPTAAHGPLPPHIIQTSAPINPGNSGGPVTNVQGQVIGIATATLMGAQGIGFAIPINIAKQVLAEFAKHGRLARPWLGIGGKFPTDELTALLAIPLAGGLLIEEVEDNSPAALGGLKAGTLRATIEGVQWVLGGDMLLAINGHPTRDPAAFRRAVQSLTPNDFVQLDIVREGSRLKLIVLLRERPAGSLRPKPITHQAAVVAPAMASPWNRDIRYVGF